MCRKLVEAKAHTSTRHSDSVTIEGNILANGILVHKNWPPSVCTELGTFHMIMTVEDKSGRGIC